MIPASLIATHLQMPLSDVSSMSRGVAFGRSGVPHHGEKKRILLVDDSCNKGRAMNEAVSRLRNTLPGSKITRLAVYAPYQSDEDIVDITFEECKGPRVFQWNMWKHIRLVRWGFDFDGVFCRDCRNHENDDGPEYLKFLNGAEPLFIPQREIGHIVTARLEKYRPQTEAWLARYGIKFQSLTMMPYKDKGERMAAGNRGGWKASVAKEKGVEFFIESSPSQASKIAKEANIQVWCTETQSLA